jgi:hypothetical protein
MNNKIITLMAGMILLMTISLFGFVSAEDTTQDTQANVCCEKTTSGAWCQNTVEGSCDSNFRKTPTNCEATSFCKPGICFDSSEGLCMENTPQKVCNDAEGTWVDDSKESVPQCNLGCCALGTQASFVTLTRCKKLSGLYGLETNFRTDISDELSCIAIAAAQDQGACVFESEFQTTCKFTTRKECSQGSSGGNITSTPEFYKDFLCSAEELATNCGPSKNTFCVPGKDEVYFEDTCGNPANIYDASKVNDKSYWRKIIDKSESCNYNDANGNSDSRNCGNCDYFKGSICTEGRADVGDNYCSDLNCYNTEDGNDYKNGESWCIYDDVIGEGRDLVGSRHYRHVCINGEETVEPCADFRSEQCIQSNIEASGVKFTEAACRVNRWTDCIDQDDEEKCLNTDRRDCYWNDGAMFTGLQQAAAAPSSSSGGNVFNGGSITGNAIFGGGSSSDDDDDEGKADSGIKLGGGSCLPNIAPGLKFWSNGDASGICSLGNSVCVVQYKKGLIGDEECIENCECLKEGYAQEMNQVCSGLGDCGAFVNIAGKFTDEGAELKVGGKKRTIGASIVQNLRR